MIFIEKYSDTKPIFRYTRVMSETGGIDIGSPSEGGSGAPEQLSESAKQRFAAAGAQMAAAKREEKRSRKRDTKVAKTILQFLNDDRYAHLFVLISRLVARDCPSIFILGVLALINEEAKTVVHEYMAEEGQESNEKAVQEQIQATQAKVDPTLNRLLVEWITLLQMVLALDPQGILNKLMVDEANIDGTILQLASFVLQEFFRSEAGGRREAPFPSLQTLAVNILQTVFEPFLDAYVPKQINSSDDE